MQTEKKLVKETLSAKIAFFNHSPFTELKTLKNLKALGLFPKVSIRGALGNTFPKKRETFAFPKKRETFAFPKKGDAFAFPKKGDAFA